MKVLVYLVMWLLLDPILRVAGVAVSGLFLVGMVALGVYLLLRRTDRGTRGPQPVVPPQVYVVPSCCGIHDNQGAGARHPGRQDWIDGTALSWGSGQLP
ncbi:hypothetical protein E2F47_25050 [Mycobacterium eburneum]|nr:hypothetical protein [Mycobacterium eburneum]TDH48135.1 hypothetical protein E2F47_25050 [Mycobacterium eburneum]